MCPRAADANLVVVAAFAIANIVGEVAGRPGSGGFGLVGISHFEVSFLGFRLRQSRPDGTR
jgi:hypothetical protein